MSANLVGLLYLVSGVLFIQALRGLSSPETSGRGNFFGIAGMTIAVLTTLGSHPPADAVGWGLVVGGMAGSMIGAPLIRAEGLRKAVTDPVNGGATITAPKK